MDGLAIDRQCERCEELAKYRHWDVVETYVDQSKSATDRTKNRPDYDRMVADYQAGMFTAIICYDLDRLTRQPRQLEDWIDAAELRGLALVTANGDADLSTDEVACTRVLKPPSLGPRWSARVPVSQQLRSSVRSWGVLRKVCDHSGTPSTVM